MSVDFVMEIRSKEAYKRFIISVDDTLNERVLEHIIVFNIEFNHSVEFPFINKVFTFQSSEYEGVK